MSHSILRRELIHKPGMTELWSDGLNIQWMYNTATPGQKVQIALKTDLRPASVRSPRSRVFAVYAELEVIEYSNCTCHPNFDFEANPEVEAGATLCPDCAESWCIDWYINSAPSFRHGSPTAYVSFGCRCPICRHGQSIRMKGEED